MDPRVESLPRDMTAFLEGREQAAADHGIELLCPFGCGIQKCNPVGHCRHLVGFTIDMKTVELRERYGVGENQPNHERTGYLIRELDSQDRLIGTMKKARRNSRKQHTPTPTYRVYRQDGRAPVLDNGKYQRRAESVSQGWEDFESDLNEDEEAEETTAVKA